MTNPSGSKDQRKDGPGPSLRQPQRPYQHQRPRRTTRVVLPWDSLRYRQSEPSIVGTIPEGRPSDFDVYAKYDFGYRSPETEDLVINKVKEKIMNALHEHQVVMIEGFTGCGKTTQVPQFILDDAQENGTSCRVAVTQPRRIAAISVAARVANERKWKLGGLVGYQVGMDRCMSPDTCVTYMTTGVLLQLLINRKNLDEWTHIIVDEVHERDIDTDLLLLVIKKIMIDTFNTRTKIILMSATLNPDKFAEYFPMYTNAEQGGKAARVVIDIPVRFEIKEYFIEDMAKNFGYIKFTMEGLEEAKVHQECLEIATKTIEQLDELEDEEAQKLLGGKFRKLSVRRGAVLMFLPGLLEIETAYKVLNELAALREKAAKTRGLKWLILPLHSSITTEEQQRVFLRVLPHYRKIILATNIAESSITVPDVKYVMDFCLTKNLSCDPTTNYTCLRLDWASKNQCIQRRGRCGRVSTGIYYRLVTKSFYNTLLQEALPEMISSSLESTVLQVKLLNMGSPREVLKLAVDPPDESNVARAVANLKEIGAMTILKDNKHDRYDGDLTFMGRVLSRLPIDIRLGRLILLGYAFDCLEEAIVIAAGLSVKSPFAYPYSKRLEAYLSKMTWSSNQYSDLIALLNIYTTWYGRHQRREFHGFGDEKGWAKKYFIQVSSLREMRLLVEEIHKRLAAADIEFTTTAHPRAEQTLILKLVIAGAFYPNYFIRTRPEERQYTKDIGRELLGMDRYSSVALQNFPSEQPAELYKKELATKFVFEHCIPIITIKGAKMVVTFDSRSSKIGPFSRAVYRCIKFRQLRNTIVFDVMNREDAMKKLEDLKSVKDAVKLQPYPAQTGMPGIKTTHVQAFVTHIETPSEFFVVMKKDEMTRELVTDKLAQYADSCLVKIKPEYCAPGQFCVVKLRGTWMRGRIDAEKKNRFELLVYFLDHGLSTWVDRPNVFVITGRLEEEAINITPPALAIKCRLAKISASVRTGCVWSADALIEFEKFVSGDHHIMIEVYSVVKCVINGIVKNSDAPDAESINDILVKLKFADYVEETEASEKNNEIRFHIKTEQSNDVLDVYYRLEEIQNDCVLPERCLDRPIVKAEEAEQTIQLRGPYSPLEMLFSSLCFSSHLKQVQTEGCSINSVILDQNPDRPTAYLMVSAQVSIAARSGNLMARETTIMPAIPSLCGLMAMLFCPKMELRVDDNYDHYTGCVTGLGVDPAFPEDGCVYPDHDMEIVFDATIDNEDVANINSIRTSLNNILSEEFAKDRSQLRAERNRIRVEAMQLLDRDRKVKEPEWTLKTHEWNKLDPERLQIDPTHLSEREIAKVFPLHSPVKLGDLATGTLDRRQYFN